MGCWCRWSSYRAVLSIRTGVSGQACGPCARPCRLVTNGRLCGVWVGFQHTGPCRPLRGEPYAWVPDAGRASLLPVSTVHSMRSSPCLPPGRSQRLDAQQLDHFLLEPEHAAWELVVSLVVVGIGVVGVRMAAVEELDDVEAAFVYVEVDVSRLEAGGD